MKPVVSDRLDAAAVARYLRHVGAGPDASLAELHFAHVRTIPYENLDVVLGREVRLDSDGLVAKMVDGSRGGYCFEQNSLFAAVLEARGDTVERRIGRIRMSDATSPRPATHMALIVDEQLVDVGFGAANPLGPVPLGGEATYGAYTWSTTRGTSPEGENVWWVRLFDMNLYTFTDAPQHPVDYIAPNHLSATHPRSIFRLTTMAQHWTEVDGEHVQEGLMGLELTRRLPDGRVDVSQVEAEDLGKVLLERFGIDLVPQDRSDVARIAARAAPRDSSLTERS